MRIMDNVPPPTWVRLKQLEKKNSPDNDYISIVDEEIDNMTMPYIQEPTLSHPFNSSIVKVRNNGIIDAAVATNQLLRLDPGQKTFNVIFDGMKEHIGYFQAWIEDFAHWKVINEVWFRVEKGNYLLETKLQTEIFADTFINTRSTKYTLIEAGTTLDTYSKEDTTNTSEWNIYMIAKDKDIGHRAAGDIFEEAEVDIRSEAGSNILIKAGSQIDIIASGPVNITGNPVNINC